MMRLQFILPLIAVALSLSGLVHASSGYAVFGSFSDPANAAAEQRRLARDLGIPDARVLEVQLGGRTWLRVASVTLDRAAASALVTRARRSGWPDAWYVPVQGSSSNPVRTRPAASSSQSVRAVASDTRSHTVDGSPAARRQPTSPDATAARVQPTRMPRLSGLSRDTRPEDLGYVEPATVEQLGPGLQIVPGGSSNAGILDVPHFDDVDIRIDGKLDEAVWDRVPVFDEMVVIDPDTLDKPRYKTLQRMLYTPKGLYIGVYMEQPKDSLLARLTPRDDFSNRDSWGITLDTSGTGLYGYWMSVNLGGSVSDGKIAPERNYSREWDGTWLSATQELEDGWSLEMFLPWSDMQMPGDGSNRRMGFWTNRKVAFVEERWSYPALPFTGAQFMSALAKMELPGVEPKSQFQLVPFAATTVDVSEDEEDYRIGTDIFWRPSANFQVAATLNPDFGSVESDDVVVNLTAFEVFFPERRLFFQEGNEVFITTPLANVRSGGSTGGRRSPSFFNPTPTTVVNTRRIGGKVRDAQVPDGVSVPLREQNRFSELMGAVRATGQNGGLRYGVLAAFEDDFRLRATEDATGNSVRVKGRGRDFGVARFIYEDVGDGRRSLGYIGTYVRQPTYEAYVHGIDSHYLSGDGKLRIDGQGLFSDVDQERGYGGFVDMGWTPKQGQAHGFALEWLDRNLEINDLGFFRRNDNRRIRYSLNLNKSRGLKWLRRRSTGIIANYEANHDWRATRTGLFLRNEFVFPNNFTVRTEGAYFAPTWDDRNSRGNGTFQGHSRMSWQVGFGTDTSKPISFSGVLNAQQEQINDRWTQIGSLGFTLQPIDRFSLAFDMEYRRRNGWLLYSGGRNFTTFSAIQWQPRAALGWFFSARQQLRLTFQWSGIRADEQSRYEVPIGDGGLTALPNLGETDRNFTVSRMTTQLRYRWEIAPLSDLFLVYTRGSNLASIPGEEFTELFTEALNDPVVDVFVMKLRYRLGGGR